MVNMSLKILIVIREASLQKLTWMSNSPPICSTEGHVKVQVGGGHCKFILIKH